MFLRLGMAGALLASVIGAALALNAAYGGPPSVLAHRAAPHPQNALIIEMQITLDGPAQVFIEYENPQAGQFVTALSAPAIEHRLPIVRLRPETAYAYAIGVRGGGGQVAYGPSGEFTTGSLPPELAGLQTWAAGRSSLPLIATSYKDGRKAYYFLWDETGHIVWYYAPEEGGPESSQRIHTLRAKPNGHLVYLGHSYLAEITPLGAPVARWPDGQPPDRPHHDFLLLDDGRILYLSRHDARDTAAAGRVEDPTVAVDRLRVWDQAAGTVAEVWDAAALRELFGAVPGPERWMHTNSLSLGPGGRLIVSSRNRNQVIALAPPGFRRVEWRLGGPDSDYEFPHPGDRFYGQHTASQLPNGNILLFDNGNGRPDSEGGPYSRALELRLDPAAGTAVKAWEYRLAPDRYADLASSAFRLPSGHTLVNFGTTFGEGVVPIVFVEADGPGNEVFRVETFTADAADWSYPRSYRAAPGPAAIMGERMLRPPAGPAVPAGPPPAGWWRQPVRDPAAFNPQLDDRRVVYRKAPCAQGEIADPFFLHLYPANPGDLPEERREFGFENRDFRFGQWGAIEDGECAAAVPLPAYPIAYLRTGQYLNSGEWLWEAELPGPAAP